MEKKTNRGRAFNKNPRVSELGVPFRFVPQPAPLALQAQEADI